MIKININDTYEASFVSPNLKNFTFYSEIKDETQIVLEFSLENIVTLFLQTYLI
jgi:hypothetical protein